MKPYFLAPIIGMMCLVVSAVWAAPPAAITIHGSLTASDNSPLTGTRDYVVKFFDASVAGTQLGGDLTGTATLSDKGLFNIAIEPPAAIFSAAQVWYELAIDSDLPADGVDADDVFAARTQVQSVPFAKQAGNVGLPENGTAHVVVQTTDNAVTNAANLLAAYAAAKALTPNGAALSATNRAVVLVSPGNYDLGTGQLTLDAEFVDLVGISTAREDQYIFGTANGLGTGVLAQTANNVHIENLLVHCTRVSGETASNLPAAYFPETALPDTIVRNCAFRADNVKAMSMRLGIDYAGAYEQCAGGQYAFGGIATPLGTGTASGKFISCTGDTGSFGGQGIASGTFINCTGGHGLFGSGGIASGTFSNCTGGDYSFGGGYGGTTASGAFRDCTGGDYAFGGQGTASGTFTNCTGGLGAFGFRVLASGTFINCTGGVYAFASEGIASGAFTGCIGGMYAFAGSGTASGTFTNCTGGDLSFAGGGTASGTFTNCTGLTYAFAGNGTASGTFRNCTGGGYAFGGTGTAPSGKFHHCSGDVYSFTETGDPAPVHLFCILNNAQYSGND